ncbi:single-stranded DNA-binding protein [Enterococcus faecium]|uniref:single-stranded DNA-binding protein n=1 Tax=Enterococcus faecium TaxID=1352 RepID=UPI0015E3390E|nr:single-stranded DNA-binding protein [Enterococcus faecium]
MLNTVILQGKLTKDVELKQTNSGKEFAIVSIAVQRSYKNHEGNYDTDFFDVLFSGKQAENVAKFFHKGEAILIEGSIQQKRFTDKNGNKRTTYNIVANKFHFNAGAQRQEPKQTNLGVTPQDNFLSDDALPF